MKVKPLMPGYIGFNCPGCGLVHTIRVNGPDAWSWNGSTDSPTITPSIRSRSGHHLVNGEPDDHCWCSFEKRFGRPPEFRCTLCHSFVRDGMIEFLSDSTHALAGQTVPLEEYRGAL